MHPAPGDFSVLSTLPGIDLHGRHWVGHVSEAKRLALTQAVSFMFASARTARLKPILFTRPDSVLSPALTHLVADDSAGWIIETDEGLVDAFTGAAINGPDETFRMPELARRPTTFQAAQPRSLAVHFDLYLRHRPDTATILGGAATILFDALAAGAPVAWDEWEPTMRAWDPRTFTLDARHRMPRTPAYVIRSERGAWAMEAIRRTDLGVEEHLVGGAVLGPWPQLRTAALGVAQNALRAICRAAQVERGAVSLIDCEGDGSMAARAHATRVNAGIALGARLQRRMGLSVDTVAADPGVDLFGRSKTATAMWPLEGGAELESLWQRLTQQSRRLS